jgi:peptidoglycan/xylan/chitin deacetylase (PgdA/CDA1 family)
VIGVNAENNIDLVKREYREGHEIGNHTYSHPNIATVSAYRTDLELSATQRILENALGHSTTLFRPPYNADSEPQTPAEILPIQRAQLADADHRKGDPGRDQSRAGERARDPAP